MKRQYLEEDYRTLYRSRSRRAIKEKTSQPLVNRLPPTETPASSQPPAAQPLPVRESTFLKRGHALSFAGLFAFTVVLYARPGEFYPSPLTASLALAVGLATLLCFVPVQLSLEGKITAPLREVKLVLLFAMIGLASIPLAINRGEAWETFSSTFI